MLSVYKCPCPPLRTNSLSVCPCGDPWGTPLQLEINYSWAPVKPPGGQPLRSPRPKVPRNFLIAIIRLHNLRQDVLFFLFELPILARSADLCNGGSVLEAPWKSRSVRVSAERGVRTLKRIDPQLQLRRFVLLAADKKRCVSPGSTAQGQLSTWIRKIIYIYIYIHMY